MGLINYHEFNYHIHSIHARTNIQPTLSCESKLDVPMGVFRITFTRTLPVSSTVPLSSGGWGLPLGYV